MLPVFLPPLTFAGAVITDVLDDVSHHLLVVHGCSGCDLPTEEHHARLTNGLCGQTTRNITHTTLDDHETFIYLQKSESALTGNIFEPVLLPGSTNPSILISV